MEEAGAGERFGGGNEEAPADVANKQSKVKAKIKAALVILSGCTTYGDCFNQLYRTENDGLFI